MYTLGLLLGYLSDICCITPVDHQYLIGNCKTAGWSSSVGIWCGWEENRTLVLIVIKTKSLLSFGCSTRSFSKTAAQKYVVGCSSMWPLLFVHVLLAWLLLKWLNDEAQDCKHLMGTLTTLLCKTRHSPAQASQTSACFLLRRVKLSWCNYWRN